LGDAARAYLKPPFSPTKPSMNTKLGIAAAAAVAMLLPLAVTAATGIRSNRHDLSPSSGTAGPKSATDTQLCIFCHTPHKAVSRCLSCHDSSTAIGTGVTDAGAGGYYPSTNTANAGLFGTTAAAAGGADGSKVKIFQDTGMGGGIGIECGSCHDTHNQYGNPNLTVVGNTDTSGLCRSCHSK
jgi:predicted CXXCH cytochrome family protein